MRKTKNIKFILEHIDTKETDCIKYPFAKTKAGYGLLSYKSFKATAHRITWMIAHDNFAIDTEMDIAHLCHQRDCVNPNHLELQTSLENNQHRKDRLGEDHHLARLTVPKVNGIRALYERGFTQLAISQMYDVARTSIYKVVNNITWKHVGDIL